MEKKNRIIVMYLIGAGLVALLALILIFPTLLGALAVYVMVFGGIGFGVYKLAKKKLDRRIAITIGILFGLILFLMFSYYTYLQNS